MHWNIYNIGNTIKSDKLRQLSDFSMHCQYDGKRSATNYIEIKLKYKVQFQMMRSPYDAWATNIIIENKY